MQDRLKELTKTKNIIISLTPDLIKEKTIEDKIESLRRNSNVRTIDDLLPMKANIPIYYIGLRDKIGLCDGYIMIIGQMLSNICSLDRTILDTQYNCFFFRCSPSYLIIPKGVKEVIKNSKKECYRMINKICSLQEVNKYGKILYYETSIDLFTKLENALYELNYSFNITSNPVRNKIFISYSHKDKEWLDRLQRMLAPLVRRELITTWDDSQIPPGTDWMKEIKEALDLAKVAVLLVSPNFFASDFIVEHELLPLIEANETKGLTILWVAVSYSMYKDTPIKKYQAVNDPSRPLNSLSPSDQDKILLDICKKIGQASIDRKSV
jgi:hypothetical protein